MTHIILPRAVVEQVLEALEADNSKLWPSDKRTEAYFNLRAAMKTSAQETGEPLAVSERKRWEALLFAAGRVLQAFDDGYLQPDTETLQGGIALDALREAWKAFAPAQIQGPDRKAEPVQEHEDWCASVTQLLLSYPPQKAPCNCKKKQAESVPEQRPCGQCRKADSWGIPLSSNCAYDCNFEPLNGDPKQAEPVPLFPPVPQRQRGCAVCGIGADGKAFGYVCPRYDCPTRITCGGII